MQHSYDIIRICTGDAVIDIRDKGEISIHAKDSYDDPEYGEDESRSISVKDLIKAIENTEGWELEQKSIKFNSLQDEIKNLKNKLANAEKEIEKLQMCIAITDKVKKNKRTI